jgi:hypothetical protein
VTDGVSPPSRVSQSWDRTTKGQVIVVEVRFDGLEIRHTSRNGSGSIITDLKVFFDHILQLLLQLNQVGGRR